MDELSKEPLVSVIIPTFNRERFLREAIESVLNQSYRNVEILVVDDGSTDNTSAVLASYSQDSRLRHFYQKNQGQAVAKNHGLAESKGEFVCFLDSDNRWLQGKLEKSLAVFAARPDVDIVYGDIVTIDEFGSEVSRKNMARYSGKIAAHLFKDNCVSINTSMTRRRCFDVLGGFETTRRRADDYEFWLRMSTQFNFYYLPEYLSEYRVMDDQISSDKSGRFRSNEELLRNFIERFPHVLSIEEQKEGWCRFHTRKGSYYASIGDVRTAIREYRKALGYRFFHKAPWRAIARLAILQR